MSGVENTSQHYDAVIKDLDTRRTALLAEIHERHRRVAELDGMIAALKAFQSGDATAGHERTHASTVKRTEVADYLVGLSLSDACVAVIKRVGRPITNREILTELESGGWEMDSSNPVNNIGTCLNRRAKQQADVVRLENTWALAGPKEMASEIAISDSDEEVLTTSNLARHTASPTTFGQGGNHGEAINGSSQTLSADGPRA